MKQDQKQPQDKNRDGRHHDQKNQRPTEEPHSSQPGFGSRQKPGAPGKKY